MWLNCTGKEVEVQLSPHRRGDEQTHKEQLIQPLLHSQVTEHPRPGDRVGQVDNLLGRLGLIGDLTLKLLSLSHPRAQAQEYELSPQRLGSSPLHRGLSKFISCPRIHILRVATNSTNDMMLRVALVFTEGARGLALLPALGHTTLESYIPARC